MWVPLARRQQARELIDTCIPADRKFGKHLQKRQLDIPEYAASFVNYKALKKLIKKLSATPVLQAQNAPPLGPGLADAQASLQANKATFFFRLERELEKVNAFYLQKEAELKLRLKTLLDKKRVMQSRSQTASKTSANFITLEEGFQQFIGDLNKLQQYVEINATAFSKILKKWDKTSKSRTKELYLSRAVEVQPCFNRDIITELSDQATTSLLELGAWAEGEKVHYPSRAAEHMVSGQPVGSDNNDTDSQFLDAVSSGNLSALKDWIARLKDSPDAANRITRTFLAAIVEAPEQSLTLLLETGLVDIHSEDEINERNCLHEAAISGRIFVLQIGLTGKVDVARVDVYGRIPLHYACTHGRVDMLRSLLQAGPTTIDALDHDNYTPLIHAIVHQQIDCVKQLLASQARIDPTSEADHIPLNLACQHNSVEIVKLLLEKKAQVLPDAEGLFPQHLVARSGKTPELLLLLRGFGAHLDEIDRLNQWTPLFHAASEGRVACLQTLLECGARVDILDEKQLSAMYYAAWEGHLECMRLLGSAGLTSGLARPTISTQSVPSSASGATAALAPVDADGIPDLSLPPPIIPLRRYGHNFLDSKTFVQIGFEEAGSDAIIFYHDSKYPAARLTISSKLSDLIPRNVLLPIQEDTRIISFQIDKLDTFAIDFDIFPTFGSKVIARTVALSNIFNAVTSSSGHCCLPLFDPRLRAIGQISFNFQVIKPFPEAPLEITDFATYWKATSQFDFHPTALITGSSLSGEYVRLFVQLTSDLVPVLYPRWTVNHGGIDFPVGSLTYAQFVAIGGLGDGRGAVLSSLSQMYEEDIRRLHRVLATSFFSLREALSYLAPKVHVELQVLYPTGAQERLGRLSISPNLNVYVDAILKEVFDHARRVREEAPDFMRSIIFSSYNADACTALNWKQPNYPVFLCNDLGKDETGNAGETGQVKSSGGTSISVKEAVRIAQSNNFMGLICCSQLLDMVPALIESVKVAGLVLVKNMSGEGAPGDLAASAPAFQLEQDGVDGVLWDNGVLRFHETIDV
ncbi:MAG: phosphate system positive regulatory protein pho81 [Thelocarpon impressellum]|nr:MAG: phosphate system positive regulatory protein pho81 [Thelocarpon impressellum]